MLVPRRSDLKLVGLLVWCILSVGVLITLVLPFIVPQEQLAGFMSTWEWQTEYQRPCAFCGMTTAFYAISRGDFVEAHGLNPLSLYVYAAFLLNTFLVVFALKPIIIKFGDK